MQGSPCKGPHSDFLRSLTLDGAGMRRSVAPSPNILLNLLRASAAHTRDYFPFTRKDRTSASCVALLFCGAETFCKDVAGLLSPRPRFLSCRKERNQRFAKEEVSSLETPLRGKTAPLLSALSYFSVCGPENGQSPFSKLLRRKILSPPDCSASRRMSGIAPTTSGSKRLRHLCFSLGSGVSKGACPFRRKSKNQKVFGAPFVHFLAIGNGPRGAGAGSPPANRSLQGLPCNK